MNSFNKKLCSLLILNLFIIFSFFGGYSYAVDNTPVMDNLNDYTYKQTIPEATFDLINKCESETNVINNSFYYFIIPTGFNSDGSLVFKRFLFNKSVLKNIYFRFQTDSSNGMYYTGLYIYFTNEVSRVAASGGTTAQRFSYFTRDLTNNNQAVFPDGNAGCWYSNNTGLDSSYCVSALTIPCYSYFNNGTYLMPFVTNFPYDIKGSSVNFNETSITPIVRKAEPYLLNHDSELQMSSYDTLGVLCSHYETPVDIYLKIINQSTKDVILSIKCNDYQKYVSRSNIDDPFSYLSYNIPLEVLPSYELLENKQYNFQVSYVYGSATIYNNNYILVAIPLNHVQTSQPGEGEVGGNTTGGSTVTPEDDRNHQLQNSINESTDRIVESNKETQNKLEEQTEAIKENTETNKNIFEKIGDILSFINPFSENFFGRKLVELIIDGLKSLFVPEDGFFENYFNEIRDWFNERLGFLFAPFDFIIELLNRITNINFSEPIINIPDIKAPFSDINLINAQSYNLNDLNNNEIFNNIHNIYLIGVDFVILIGLINLARKKIEEVFVN